MQSRSLKSSRALIPPSLDGVVGRRSMLYLKAERTSFTVKVSSLSVTGTWMPRTSLTYPTVRRLLQLEAVVRSRGLIVANLAERLADRLNATKPSFLSPMSCFTCDRPLRDRQQSPRKCRLPQLSQLYHQPTGILQASTS